MGDKIIIKEMDIFKDDRGRFIIQIDLYNETKNEDFRVFKDFNDFLNDIEALKSKVY